MMMLSNGKRLLQVRPEEAKDLIDSYRVNLFFRDIDNLRTLKYVVLRQKDRTIILDKEDKKVKDEIEVTCDALSFEASIEEAEDPRWFQL